MLDKGKLEGMLQCFYLRLAEHEMAVLEREKKHSTCQAASTLRNLSVRGHALGPTAGRCMKVPSSMVLFWSCLRVWVASDGQITLI